MTAAEPLADSAVTLESLDALAGTLDGAALRAALPWLVAGCATYRLVSEIEAAATKIHNLVAAVKGFTYMDQATMPKPVDVRQGLSDTLAVLNAKARGKSVVVSLEAPADLPRVSGFGGELNQVWANLVTTLDAAKGSVAVTAESRSGSSSCASSTTDRTARGDQGARLRSLLHDEAGRARYRPRPRHRAPHRPQALGRNRGGVPPRRTEFR